MPSERFPVNGAEFATSAPSFGESVIWSHEDPDVPCGSVGTVVGSKEESVIVLFDSGKYAFNPLELLSYLLLSANI